MAPASDIQSPYHLVQKRTKVIWKLVDFSWQSVPDILRRTLLPHGWEGMGTRQPMRALPQLSLGAASVRTIGQALKRFALNLNRLTLPGIRDFNALSDAFWFKLNAKRPNCVSAGIPWPRTMPTRFSISHRLPAKQAEHSVSARPQERIQYLGTTFASEYRVVQLVEYVGT